ncbi:MAG TPA: hypothetical protein VGB62_05980 [Allosphingosinicella sp.]|jgi:hypothetical protein
MAIKVNSMAAWSQARAALVENLSSTMELLEDAPYSDDPQSPYQQAEAQSQRILGDLKTLAVAGLKQIDAQIASGGVVAQIAAQAAQAKQEADLLANAAKTIGKITKAVDLASSVVTKISALPFV